MRPTKELIDHVYFCASYFDGMRTEWQTTCQVKIAYHWRKYWKRKQKRLADEAAKLAKKKALAAKKKGKKGKAAKGKKKGTKSKSKKGAADLDSTNVTPDLPEDDQPDEDKKSQQDGEAEEVGSAREPSEIVADSDKDQDEERMSPQFIDEMPAA